ncbi:hypothetical protein [Muricomes intestini]|uniref:hypothetical protein n=1 Tax=Muricomes intestini TaxID=1796634 RepID=UPI0026B0B6D8
MKPEDFYGSELLRLNAAQQQLLLHIEDYQRLLEEKEGRKVIQYCHARIKTPESMLDKLERKRLPQLSYNCSDRKGSRVRCNRRNSDTDNCT